MHPLKKCKIHEEIFLQLLHLFTIWSLENFTFGENTRRRDLHAVFFGLLLDIRQSPSNILLSAVRTLFLTYLFVRPLTSSLSLYLTPFFLLRQREGDFIYVTLFKVPTFLYKFLGRYGWFFALFVGECSLLRIFSNLYRLLNGLEINVKSAKWLIKIVEDSWRCSVLSKGKRWGWEKEESYKKVFKLLLNICIE